jgi:carboxyl-terminal processing protease
MSIQAPIKTIKINDKISENSFNQKDFLEEITSLVKKDYVDEKSDLQLSEAAASGILSSLDPHSSYLNEEALKEMQVQTKGEFGGLGIEITTELSAVKVVAAIEDTPAFKSGVKTGDYIIKINDKQ